MSEKIFKTLVGYVGGDPVTKETRAGNVTELSIGVPTGNKPGDQSVWVQVSVWNEGLQESVKSEVYKGTMLGVLGQFSSYEKDGRTYRQIQATDIILGEKLKKSPSQFKAPVVAAEAPVDLGF